MYNIPECVIDGYNLKKSGHDMLNWLAYRTLVEGYFTSHDDEILESHIPYIDDEYNYDPTPEFFMEGDPFSVNFENLYKLVY